jgi:dTDP-4-amino-4,6-dideoxygalactose transaminase
VGEMIPLFKVTINSSVGYPLLETLHSGYIGQGPKVELFEKQLAEYLGNPRVLTVNSGTSALHLALHMANVRGKYVITTPLTCTATNWPILANGGKILWSDIEGSTPNISVDSVERLLQIHGNSVAAIMVVHWGGYPVSLDEITELSDYFGVPVIEDAAHAFGSEYYGSKIGNISRFTCFSFQAIKHLTTIDGGLLCLQNEEDYKRAKLLRWYGIDRENQDGRKDLRCEDDILEWGYKFHMNDINATIGIENLKLIPEMIQTARSNAKFYNENLKNVSGVTLTKEYSDRQSSYWLYTMLVDRRDDFMEYMKSCEIMTSKVHARNDDNTCVKQFKRPLPFLEEFVKKMICIPVTHVSNEEREYIVDCIKKGW